MHILTYLSAQTTIPAIINYRDHTSGLHWDNERGANVVTEGDKNVFESYLLGAFGGPEVKGKVCHV